MIDNIKTEDYQFTVFPLRISSDFSGKSFREGSMAVKAFLIALFLVVYGGKAFCEEPMFITVPITVPKTDVDPERYNYLLTYCTEVRDFLGLSISFGPSVEIDGAKIPSIVAQLTLTPRGTRPRISF